MSALSRRVRRFLQRPGTVDLSAHQCLLPAIAVLEERLRSLRAYLSVLHPA